MENTSRSHQEWQNETKNKLYSLVRQIPRGSVVSYGWLGSALGISPRLVGRYLHQNPDSSTTPCHRVVRADGSLASGYAFGGLSVQRQLLEQEGVIFTKNRVAKQHANVFNIG
ncbi:MGMT family protein [Candidatus Woesebacteria bacterium]|nr:MGMT family protein [Candidatus Woesebacteria bacterium]